MAEAYGEGLLGSLLAALLTVDSDVRHKSSAHRFGLALLDKPLDLHKGGDLALQIRWLGEEVLEGVQRRMSTGPSRQA